MSGLFGCYSARESVIMNYMPGAPIWPDVILHGGIRMRSSDCAKCIVPSQVSRLEQHFEIHHVVDDDLENNRHLRNFRSMRRTWKSGSGESQLLVHPTMALKRFASNVAKLFTAVIAV